MSGNSIGGRRAADAAKAAWGIKFRQPGWLTRAGGSALLIGFVAALGMQTVSAEEVAPATTRVVTEKQQEELAVEPRSETKNPEPKPAGREPGAQASAPSNGALPEAEASGVQANGSATHLAVPKLILSADLANKIGHKVWLNETGGRADAITSWNANEEFASLGIGHFIWFPVGKWLPFEESFPSLLEFMRKRNVRLPVWLNQTQIPACPWTSRADFKAKLNSPEMRQLRQFLLDTVAEQTQFLVVRAQGAMEKILKTTPDGADRAHIVTQFSRIVRASENLYPLIDYINFKGEGTNPNETAIDRATGQRQGWGLKQVLLKMNGDTSDPKAVRAEFADAVQSVLQQRVRNIPANRVFEVGWLRRAETYRRPIAEQEPGARRVQGNVSPTIAAR